MIFIAAFDVFTIPIETLRRSPSRRRHPEAAIRHAAIACAAPEDLSSPSPPPTSSMNYDAVYYDI
jgi:hypothetical protein